MPKLELFPWGTLAHADGGEARTVLSYALAHRRPSGCASANVRERELDVMHLRRDAIGEYDARALKQTSRTVVELPIGPAECGIPARASPLTCT